MGNKGYPGVTRVTRGNKSNKEEQGVKRVTTGNKG